MIPKSIRWRLPLSYAGIALLAALVLGGVLLFVLRGYYAQRERVYLLNNARAIGDTLSPLLTQPGATPNELQAQVESLSFLSQTRIRILDADRQILADSGPFDISRIRIALGSRGSDFEAFRDAFIRLGEGEDIPPDEERLPAGEESDETIAIIVPRIPESTLPPFPRRSAEQLFPYQSVINSDFSVVGTLQGFDLSGAADSAGGRRSNQEARISLYPEPGKLEAIVVLSEGPAYGNEIVGKVAWGWAIAAAVAVILAASAGWFISRGINAPLLDLTSTTARMAQGDLSARASVISQKEFESLAHSFLDHLTSIPIRTGQAVLSARANLASRDKLGVLARSFLNTLTSIPTRAAQSASPNEFGLLAHSFNQMADRVEETIVTLRHFVSDAAHEIHTPLTALRTNLELMADENDVANQKVLVERAQEQVGRLESLTSGLLDLSRLEAEAGQEDHVQLELVTLVRDVSEAYASRAEQVGLAFNLTLPEGPVTVEGDKAQLRQVLGNLLDNAVKFTSEGGAVSAGVRQNGERVELWVEDTGIGIPADDLPDLFGRFHRGRNAAGYPGSGLGLAIVKAIVEKHRGSVDVASTPGQGTRFTLRLPVQ